MYTIDAVRTLEGLRARAPEWNELLSRSELDVPFLSPEWVTEWWKVYGQGKEMLALFVKDGGEVKAIVPLMKVRTRFRGLPVTMISFIDDFHAERLGFIFPRYERRLAEVLFDYLQAAEGSCDMYCFHNVPKGSATEAVIQAGLRHRQLNYVVREGHSSPYIPVQTDWDEYYKDRSKNFRHKLNRIHNLFKRQGNYEIVKYTDKDIARAMGELLAVSRKTWKFKNGSAIASKDHDIMFYTGLAHAAAARGQLNLWILRYEGNPVAFAYNLEWRRKIYALKIGFDEKYGHLAPNEFLNSQAIKECFENKCREYDWLGPFMPFKRKWTSVCREHVKYLVFNDVPRAGLLHLIETRVIPRVRGIFKKKGPVEPEENE
jgi:CelD/BcsL family acetyltransferase involved in cellulose biosynthesis